MNAKKDLTYRQPFVSTLRRYCETELPSDINIFTAESKQSQPPRADWTISDVVDWARNIVGDEAVKLLLEQEIDGETLLRISQEDLERWGMKGGPANKIITARKKRHPTEASYLLLPDNNTVSMDPGTTLEDVWKVYPESYLVDAEDESIIHTTPKFLLVSGKKYNVKYQDKKPHPEDLFQICQSFPGYRTDFSSPTRKVFNLATYTFQHPYGREDAMKLALDLIYKRWNASEPIGDVERRIKNRLVGLMSAPGGGKTFFLDLIKNSWKEEYSFQIFDEHPEFRDCLSSIIYLPVSFNGATPLRLTSFTSYKVEFAVRLLYAYCFDTLNAENFVAFRIKMENYLQPETLSNQDVISFIQSAIYQNEIKYHGKSHQPRFFVLLDEISKVNTTSLPYQAIDLATEFGSILDSNVYGYYDGIISTLDETTLKNATQTGSLRGIQWIPLPPPGFLLAQKIFSTFFQEIEDNEIKKLSTNRLLLYIIYLASNHWRSLEVIAKLLKGGQIKEPLDYAELVDLVIANIPGKAQPGGEIGENFIIDSIQARNRSFGEYLLCGSTFEKAISIGYYINTRESESAIPLMSCLIIAHWAKKYSPSNHLAKLLNKLFRSYVDRPDWYTYEQCHTLWEAIRCYSFVQSHNLKEAKSKDRVLLRVSDLYNSLGQSEVNDRQLYIQKKVYVSDDYNDISLLLNDILTPDGKLKDKAVLSKIYHLGGRSKGCDSISFHEDDDGNILVRALSLKFGETDEAKQTFPEISEGYDKIHEVFKEYPTLKDRIYFILISWRNPTRHVSIPHNTIILTKDNLSQLYSSFNFYQRPDRLLDDPSKLSINSE